MDEIVRQILDQKKIKHQKVGKKAHPKQMLQGWVKRRHSLKFKATDQAAIFDKMGVRKC